MVHILIFNISRYSSLADIKYYYDTSGETNIDIILRDFSTGTTEWSVPEKAVPGDTVLFYCGSTARKNLGLLTSHIPSSYGSGFQAFVDQQKALYKKYSGYILGYGVVTSSPVFDNADGRWYSNISQLRQFMDPIYIDSFKSFITIPQGSYTTINNEQWGRLQWLVNQTNPGMFQNVTAPNVEVLNKEFEDAVKKEKSKSIDKLKKDAKKKASMPTVSNVQTRIYHRDPTIAAYVKKRANGCCQLCGQKAPFDDQNGDPYLECHHIDWLSKGGMDSAENCVVLCPNCHRRMHILNDPTDINTLKAKIK